MLAWNEALGQTSYYTVTDAYTDVHEVLVYLIINGEEVTTTPEHPFLRANGEWTPAGELAIGADLRRADGSVGRVQAIAFAATPQVMYNMTVADAHTYTVGDGAWVVHNSCGITKFPNNPDDLSTLLGAPGKDTISSIHGTRQIRWRSGNIEVRYESHIMDSGLFNSRHHGPHYHVGVRPDGAGWGQAEKLEPLGYILGHGTGFLPDEDIPAALFWAMD